MSRLPINRLEVVVAIAEHGSLRRAASVLGVQPPSVSYQLTALEERIGTSLFVRTTRSVSLTDAGKALLARAGPALAELGEALEDARSTGSSRRGAVRIAVPFVAYQIAIAPHLAAFQNRYPEIELELSFNEAFENIAAEGFHAGVRLGDHIQQDMIALRLTPPLTQVVFGAPSYIERHGRPTEPADLLQHNCIRYRYIASRRFAEWQFNGTDGITTVDVRGNLIVNSTVALVAAAEDGLGLGWLFRPNVENALGDRRLVSVLDSHAIERPGYSLYYPKSGSRTEALRVFVNFMRQRQSA